MRATRAQYFITGNYVTILQVSSAVPSELGDYRIVFQMKSNVGAGNQSVKIAKNLTGGMTFNLTEGARTTVDLTFALSANNDNITILTNGTTPLDILFSKVQVPFYRKCCLTLRRSRPHML